MSAIGIIPARYGSTRLPAKALARLAGKPLIQHVYERAKQATHVQEIFVATDDERIALAVGQFGGKAVMTSETHRSGTDRVAEVARKLDAQVIINIQGDETLVHPSQIDQLAEFLTTHQGVPMASLMTLLTRAEDIASLHVVKVVVDEDGYALYFSRAPIPFVRAAGESTHPGIVPTSATYFKHLGLYGYQRSFLLQIPHLAATRLEQAEQLEQLRVLEHGYRIKMLQTPYDTVSVDTAEDLARVEQLLNTRQTPSGTGLHASRRGPHVAS